MKESQIETQLVRGVRALGGRAYKFVSPGNTGVPDRLVVLPGGRIIFVELKTDTGKLSPMQIRQIDFLRSRGVPDAGASSCCIILQAMADGMLKVLKDC